eukprot:6345753-Lingulodinium_polyedra.AAC.1
MPLLQAPAVHGARWRVRRPQPASPSPHELGLLPPGHVHGRLRLDLLAVAAREFAHPAGPVLLGQLEGSPLARPVAP